jgi:hypothetical protein
MKMNQDLKALYKRTFVFVIKHKRIHGAELRFQADYAHIRRYFKHIGVEACPFDCADWFVKEGLFSKRSYTQKLSHTRRSHAWRYQYLTKKGKRQAKALGLSEKVIEKKWNETKGVYVEVV